MITRAPFLKTRYGGYFHREIPEEDGELTHVGANREVGIGRRALEAQLLDLSHPLLREAGDLPGKDR